MSGKTLKWSFWGLKLAKINPVFLILLNMSYYYWVESLLNDEQHVWENSKIGHLGPN